MYKKILITIFTILIAVSGFLTGFFSVGVISVYAAVNDDSIYVPLREQSDLVTAFQVYCKSRDLTIEGSLTDAVTTFTTGAFNSACNELGINISQLQAEIKAEYDKSGKPVKFLYNTTGIGAMNRIFAQFLQDNELQVGDSANQQNNTVYSGDIFTDDEGHSCLVYIVNSNVSGSSMFSIDPYNQNNLVSLGTPYMYDGSTLASMYESNGDRFYVNFYVGGHTSNYGSWINRTSQRDNNITYYNYGTADTFLTDIESSAFANVMYSSKFSVNGNLAIAYNTVKSKWAVCSFTTYNGNYYLYPLRYDFIPNSGTTNNVVVFLTTNNTVINNNNYEGDTIINNEGDVIINEPDPTPSDPNDTIHNVPQNPLGPDGIQLPDIDIPNLPIGNLSEKFPFSIPWDLAAFYAMLDAEPEAPRFNGTMDLTLVQWNYDIDLSPFDSAAELCRKLQFGLFVVGLIVASRSIIRG